MLATLVTAGALVGCLYLYGLQGVTSGRRTLFLALAGFIALSVPLFLLFKLFILPQFSRLRRWQQIAGGCMGIVCGLILLSFFFPWGIPELLVFPHKLEVIATGERNPAAQGSVVELTGFQTERGYLSYAVFEKKGVWQRLDNSLVTMGDAPAMLTWSGWVRDSVLSFRSSNEAGIVTVVWDGQASSYDLYAKVEGAPSGRGDEIQIHNVHQQPVFSRVLALSLVAVPLVLLCLLILAGMVKVWGEPASVAGPLKSSPLPWAEKGMILVFSLAGSLLFLAVTDHIGLWIASDSSNYLAAARHFLAGEGYVALNMDVFDWWPPLYPLLLMPLELLPVDVFSSARLLNAFLHAATLYASGILLYRLLPGESRATRMAGMALLFVARPLVDNASHLLSEQLFILFIVLFFIFLDKYRAEGRRLWAGLATLSAAGVGLTRYIGATLIVAGCVSFLLPRPEGGQDHRLNWPRRFLQAAWFGFTASFPLAVWMGRNYLVTGLVSGVRTASTQSLGENIQRMANTVYAWYLPPLGLPPTTVLPVVFAIFVLILIWKWRNARRKRVVPLPRKWFANSTMDLGIFVLIYTVLLVVYLSLLQNAPLGSRLLSPIFIPLTVLLVVVYHRQVMLGQNEQAADQRTRRVDRWLSLALLGLLLVQPGRGLFETAGQSAIATDRLLATRSLLNSELIAYLKAHPLPEGAPLYSNCPRCLFIFTGIHPVTQFDALPSHRRFRPETRPFYIVWFKGVPPEGAPPSQDVPMPEIGPAFQYPGRVEKIAVLKDGSIYRLEP